MNLSAPIQTLARSADVISGQADLEVLQTFPDFPVFMGCSTGPSSQDLLADMSFSISRSSGMIQLNPLLPLDVLYPEAHGAGCVGAAWQQHHQALADFIARYAPNSVLEIGGAHGILAANYQRDHDIAWTIVEPNPMPVAGCLARFIQGFFDEQFRFPEPVDAVVHSHVFEHIYNPDLFVQHLAGFLPAGKRLIFSVPNMRVMLQRQYTNCLNFEHTVYLDEDYIELLLNRHGFRVVEKAYFLDDHSIFFCALRDPAVREQPLPADLYTVNRGLYLDYVEAHRTQVQAINRRLAQAQDERQAVRAFLFGAHVFSQYLLAFGLDLSRIESILDNDPNKQGKRLCGTEKRVQSPAVLAGLVQPLVVVRAGVYTNEIVAQIRTINPTAEFML
jgi:SAM-dependent methyltransferase